MKHRGNLIQRIPAVSTTACRWCALYRPHPLKKTSSMLLKRCDPHPKWSHSETNYHIYLLKVLLMWMGYETQKTVKTWFISGQGKVWLLCGWECSSFQNVNLIILDLQGDHGRHTTKEEEWGRINFYCKVQLRSGIPKTVLPVIVNALHFNIISFLSI